MAPPSSSSSDSSSSRSTSPEPDNKQKQTMKGASKMKDETEDASSSSGSESESDSESSNEMDTTEDAPKGDSPSNKIKVPGPQPYKAPPGFKSAKKQAPPSSNSSSILSNLRGKQVIHITAPFYLPLSKVKEISMSKVLKGKPILSHEGVEYGIPAESFGENASLDKTLLVYDPNTQSYRRQTDDVPSYHIQELIGLPETIDSNQSTVEALRDEVKPPRPQPKNLKMRFRPVGSLPAAPETLGSSSESEAEEPSFKVPPGAGEERKRKHHHTEGDATQAAGLPRKKSKKLSSQEAGGEEHGHKKSKKSQKDREEKKRKKSEKA